MRVAGFGFWFDYGVLWRFCLDCVFCSCFGDGFVICLLREFVVGLV